MRLRVDAGQHEANPLFNRGSREFDWLISQFLVYGGERIIGADGFLEILLALAILLEYFSPRRRDEDGAVVDEFPACSLQMRRGRHTNQSQIAKHVGNASVKKHDALVLLGQMIRAHIPTEHEFRKEQRVSPR